MVNQGDIFSVGEFLKKPRAFVFFGMTVFTTRARSPSSALLLFLGGGSPY